MKQFTRAVVSAALCAALSLACTLPAYAADGEMLEVNEDISVSADYDWTRFANDHLTLNVYNWGLYISDGSDDSVNVISAFEDLTGIKVNYTTFDSNESLYAKMKSGGASYDVIVPSDYMVGKMIAENMLAELDYDNIPNMANIGENYLGWSYDPDNTYSVPYTWGTTGIIDNTTMVEEPPTSWADLWDVEYAGNVLMFNNSRDAYAIAAKKMGLSLNPSSVEEVDDVMKELQAQKSVVQAAEMFINFMCEPDVGYQNCDFIGYSTPITEVWERLDDDLKYSPIAYPSDEVMNKAEVFVTLPDDINAEMDAKWSEMKSYDESGSGWLIVVFLLGAIAISGFNIWRKMSKKVRDNY